MQIKKAMAAYHARTGEQLDYEKLGVMIWPDISKESARTRVARLATYRNRSIDIYSMMKFSQVLGVSLDELFPQEIIDKYKNL